MIRLTILILSGVLLLALSASEIKAQENSQKSRSFQRWFIQASVGFGDDLKELEEPLVGEPYAFPYTEFYLTNPLTWSVQLGYRLSPEIGLSSGFEKETRSVRVMSGASDVGCTYCKLDFNLINYNIPFLLTLYPVQGKNFNLVVRSGLQFQMGNGGPGKDGRFTRRRHIDDIDPKHSDLLEVYPERYILFEKYDAGPRFAFLLELALEKEIALGIIGISAGYRHQIDGSPVTLYGIEYDQQSVHTTGAYTPKFFQFSTVSFQLYYKLALGN